jgi:hypothetical protein
MHVINEFSAVKATDVGHQQDSDVLRPHSYTRWEVDKIKLYLDERGFITDSNTAAQFFLGCSFLEKAPLHISRFLPQLEGVRLIDEDGHVSDCLHALAESEEHLKFYSVSGHVHFGKMRFFQDGNYFNRTIRLMIIPKI